MTDATQEKIEAVRKPKGPGSGFSQSGNSHSVNRMANKQRKRRAHRRNLKRSNANG